MRQIAPCVQGRGRGSRRFMCQRIMEDFKGAHSLVLEPCLALACCCCRSVLERVAGMRLVYKQACMTRVISFEYLNRQLVWQELSEVLLFALPLLDVARLKRMMLALLARLPNPALLLSQRQEEQQQQQAATGGRAKGGPGLDEGPQGPGVGKEAWPSAPCPVCGSQQLLLPFEALPCRHVFCYYCLRSNCEADVGFACPLDGSRVEAMRRWSRGARA